MLERVRRATTRSQPRLKRDRQHPLQPVWDYDVTSARFAPEVRPDGRRLACPQASVPDQLRDLRRTGSAPSDRARDSAHKWFLNPDLARARSSAVSAQAFPRPAGSRKVDWSPERVDGR